MTSYRDPFNEGGPDDLGATSFGSLSDHSLDGVVVGKQNATGFIFSVEFEAELGVDFFHHAEHLLSALQV